jgi:hypothetical protein
MNLSDVETGCYIDGSHMSSFDFTALVIEMAHDYGFEMEWDQFVKDVEWMRTPNPDDAQEEAAEILDALDWTYEDAIEYLNTNTREGLVWVVREQSLYLMTFEEADD